MFIIVKQSTLNKLRGSIAMKDLEIKQLRDAITNINREVTNLNSEIFELNEELHICRRISLDRTSNLVKLSNAMGGVSGFYSKSEDNEGN